MVKKTTETYECDVCGSVGERYCIIYPDGTLVLDRCERHASKLLSLRDEKGSWSQVTPGGKTPFRLSSLEEIEKQRKQVKNGK